MSGFSNQPFFHVPSQSPCTPLGGCLASQFVVVRFYRGMVLSVRQVELVPNEPEKHKCCRTTALPEQHGVCKTCYSTFCPKCGKCNCE